MPTIQSDKITFDSKDFLDGLHPQYGTSNLSNQKLTNKLASARSFDPYRSLGYASPGFNPTDSTNVSVIDAVQTNIVVNDTKGYSIGGTKLQELTLSTNTITTPTNFPHTISAHGGDSGMSAKDLVMYKIGAVSYLFYSWRDSDDGDIGRYDLSTTFDDDYMSTVAASGAVQAGTTNPLPLIVGADDILYTGNGNVLNAFDGQNGANGTYSPSVLTLPAEYIINGFARIDPKTLVVFAYSGDAGSSFNRGKTTAFFWDYLSETFFKALDLDDNYVNGVFEYKNTCGCFTQGRPTDKTTTNRFSKLKIFDGSTFKTVATFIGNAPVTGGVDVVGDIIYWNSQGIIHSYESSFDEVPARLHKIAEGSGTSSGFLKSLTSSLQVASTGTTTAGGMESLNSNYYFQTSFSTALAKPNFPDNKKGKIKKVKVKFSKTSTGGRSITVQLRDKSSTLATVISTEKVINSTNIVKTYHETSSGGLLGTFDDLKLVVTWAAGDGATDAPILDSVEVYYKLKNLSV